LPIAWQGEQFFLTSASPLSMRDFSAASAGRTKQRLKQATPAINALRADSDWIVDGTATPPSV
jgi:hypothetical protein